MSRRSYFIPTTIITGSAALLFAGFLGPQQKAEHHDKEDTTYVSSYNAYTQVASAEEIVTPSVDFTYSVGGYSIGGGGGGSGGYVGGGGGHYVHRSRPHHRPHVRPHRPRPHRPHVRPSQVLPDRPRPPQVSPIPHRPRPPQVRPSPARPRPPQVSPIPQRPKPPQVKPPHHMPVRPKPGIVTPTPTPTPTPSPSRPTIEIDDQLPEGTTITVRGENTGSSSSASSGQRQGIHSATRNNNRSGLTDERGRRYEWIGSARRPDGSRRDLYRGRDGSTITRSTSKEGRVSFESDRTDGTAPRMVRDGGNGHRSQVRSPVRRGNNTQTVQRRTSQNRSITSSISRHRGSSIQRRSSGNGNRVSISRPSTPSRRQMRPRPVSRPRPQIRRSSPSRSRPTIRKSSPRRQHSRPARSSNRGRRR